MKILRFKFRRNSNGTFGANIMYGCTIGRPQLKDLLKESSHLIPASTAVAALVHLPEVIIEELTEGNRVRIDGLGIFKLTVKTKAVKSTRLFRPHRDVEYYDIVFQMDRKLKQKLKEEIKLQKM